MIILKREESYLSWLSFLIVSTLFSTGLHYFYSKNIYYISIWIIQIFMLFYFHSKIKQGSRKSFLFYPFSAFISGIALAILTLPAITYSAEKYAKYADSLIYTQTLSHYLKNIIPPELSEVFLLSFLLSTAIIIYSIFLYLLKSSLYKTQRFFNGFFSLTALYFIIMLFFPLKAKRTFDLNHTSYVIKYLIDDKHIQSLASDIYLFSGLLFSLCFYVMLSLFRDYKSMGITALFCLLLLILALFYFNLMYLSVFILNTILTLLIFYIASDGFKKFTQNN